MKAHMVSGPNNLNIRVLLALEVESRTLALEWVGCHAAVEMLNLLTLSCFFGGPFLLNQYTGLRDTNMVRSTARMGAVALRALTPSPSSIVLELELMNASTSRTRATWRGKGPDRTSTRTLRKVQHPGPSQFYPALTSADSTALAVYV